MIIKFKLFRIHLEVQKWEKYQRKLLKIVQYNIVEYI